MHLVISRERDASLHKNPTSLTEKGADNIRIGMHDWNNLSEELGTQRRETEKWDEKKKLTSDKRITFVVHTISPDT